MIEIAARAKSKIAREVTLLNSGINYTQWEVKLEQANCQKKLTSEDQTSQKKNGAETKTAPEKTPRL
ncbi:hypothetical protein N9D61_09190 [Planktomarina sp.]|nr:hypothetical protein [Planktomarina sp.]